MTVIERFNRELLSLLYKRLLLRDRCWAIPSSAAPVLISTPWLQTGRRRRLMVEFRIWPVSTSGSLDAVVCIEEIGVWDGRCMLVWYWQVSLVVTRSVVVSHADFAKVVVLWVSGSSTVWISGRRLVLRVEIGAHTSLIPLCGIYACGHL